MPEDTYEAKLAEFNAKADKLQEAERVLVMQADDADAFRGDLLARYDVALETRNEAGIAAYLVEVEELRKRQVAVTAALAKVRAEYDALERERPRRTWRQLVGL